VSTSTTIGSGILIGAVTGAVDGVVSGSLNQVGVNLLGGRPPGEGVGLAAGIGFGVGAALGGISGGLTGYLVRPTARRLARDPALDLLPDDKVVTSTSMMRGIEFADGFPGTMVPGKETMQEVLQNINSPQKVLTIFAHGARQGRTLYFGESNAPNYFTMSVDDIVGALRAGANQPTRISGINMLSCYSGSNGVARSLASRLNVPVRASNVVVTVRMLDAAAPLRPTFGQALRGGGFRTFYPSRLKTGWIALFGY
jgi:hypothetical protein